MRGRFRACIIFVQRLFGIFDLELLSRGREVSKTRVLFVRVFGARFRQIV